MDKENKVIRFSPEITLGQVLQLVSFIAAVLAMWFSMDKRLATVELKQEYAAEERRELRQSLATLADHQSLLVRAVDRVTITIEERERR